MVNIGEEEKVPVRYLQTKLEDLNFVGLVAGDIGAYEEARQRVLCWEGVVGVKQG